MKNIVAGFWADKTQATAIGYGLIAAGISLGTTLNGNSRQSIAP